MNSTVTRNKSTSAYKVELQWKPAAGQREQSVPRMVGGRWWETGAMARSPALSCEAHCQVRCSPPSQLLLACPAGRPHLLMNVAQLNELFSFMVWMLSMPMNVICSDARMSVFAKPRQRCERVDSDGQHILIF